MKTSYFTFGQSHAHAIAGFTYDKDIVIKITAKNPRKIMFEMFKDKWAFEYKKQPNMAFFSRGIKEIK